MNSLLISPELKADISHRESPAISLILPYEPKMSSSSELEYKIKSMLSAVKENLEEDYDQDEVSEMMLKLHNIINHLNNLTHKKSLAIFVSPSTEKVFYLDIALPPRIVINESFTLRDLVHCKKEFQRYLVLLLSGEWTRVYLGDGNHFTRIVSNIPDKIDAFRNDIPERVGNFSDPSHRKEVMLKKFLRYTDNSLHILREAYPLPLFVMGPEKILGYFKHITKNAQSIVGFVKGNFINVPEASIHAAIAPHISDWKLVKHHDLLNRIEEAEGAGRLSTGIHQVLKDARRKKGMLLIVEENFSNAFSNNKPSHIFSNSQQDNFFINDGIDQAIGYVLESSGDVEFVADGTLSHYDHIVMINYY
jgi:hypothetical protein